MKILAIGDVVGQVTLPYLRQRLWNKRHELSVDFVIANGENVTDIHGISPQDAGQLLDCGVDVITTGNHVWSRRDTYALIDESPVILRPANYPASCPGEGAKTVRIGGWRILCLNIMGEVYMEALASPFDTLDRILERERGRYDFSVLDIHAEATSEKLALARYFDGRINVIFGTHTHVPTADGQVLPGGTGYITDLGMSGPTGGIIGTDVQCVIDRFRTKMPQRFKLAGGPVAVMGALFELDTDTGRVLNVTRVTF
ncbi:MAG: TIGR00282 family metallophosphoesterase [Eubacteriales bacterium]|nr:TIGR00282 family metallophosphoesterase [Eubacteriales bacterium]